MCRPVMRTAHAGGRIILGDVVGAARMGVEHSASQQQNILLRSLTEMT